jgi:hypothetical protein
VPPPSPPVPPNPPAPPPGPPAWPPLPPGEVEVATTQELRSAIVAYSTLHLLPGRTYALGGTYLYIPTGVTVSIATRGHGPPAIIDGERSSRLFYVSGNLQLDAVNLTRGMHSTSGWTNGGAVYAYGNSASVNITSSTITDCTATSSSNMVSVATHRLTASRRTFNVPIHRARCFDDVLVPPA